MRALTSALTGALALIALQAVVSRGGSGRVTQAFGVVTSFIDRALDPTIPAIPDRRTTRTTTTTAANSSLTSSLAAITYPTLPTAVGV